MERFNPERRIPEKERNLYDLNVTASIMHKLSNVTFDLSFTNSNDNETKLNIVGKCVKGNRRTS